MLNSSAFNRFSTLAVLISGVALVAAVIYLIITQLATTPFDSFREKVVTNFRYGDSRVYNDAYNYYNGNNFMQLSLADGSKRALTGYDLLTDVGSIYWTKGGAVFNFEHEPVSTTLSDMIDAKITELTAADESVFIDSSANLYWYVNFSDGAISYVTYTDNPFEIFSDPDGEYIYFRDNTVNDGLYHLSSINSTGIVTRDVLVTSAETLPPKIIGQRENTLYITQPDDAGITISLLSYDASTDEYKTLINDLYDDGEAHTIYEDVILRDNTVLFTVPDPSTHTMLLKSVNLDTGTRATAYKGSESAVIDYIGRGLFRVVDAGDNLTKTFSIDTTGKVVDAEIITEHSHVHNEILFTASQPLFISRPYIYMQSESGRSVQTVEDTGIEKGFASDHSTLERDIYDLSGDFNTYRLYIAEGSLKEEVEKVREHVKKSDMNITDITLIPQPSRAVVYDLE